MKENNQAVMVNGTIRFESVTEAAKALFTSAKAIRTAAKTGERLRGVHLIRFEAITIDVEFVNTKTLWWNVYVVRPKKPPKWPNGHPEYQKKCEYCGDEFTTKHKGSKFCSRSHAASFIAMQKGENPKQERTCAHCSKKFMRYDPPSSKATKTFFCSRACQHQYAHDHLLVDDPKRAAASLSTRKWRAEARLTEEGKAKLRDQAHRAYLKRKAKKQQENEQGKTN